MVATVESRFAVGPVLHLPYVLDRLGTSRPTVFCSQARPESVRPFCFADRMVATIESRFATDRVSFALRTGSTRDGPTYGFL